MYRVVSGGNQPYFLHCPGFVRSCVRLKYLPELMREYAAGVTVHRPEDWTIVTFATTNNSYYPLTYQLEKSGVDYVNPLRNKTCTETFDCRVKMAEVAKMDIKTKYVMILDAGDGVFVRDLDGLTDAFESIGADIVFGANWIRHPDETIEDDIWDKEKPLHCLNGGVVFGRSDKIKTFYRHCVEISPTLDNPLRSEQKDMRVGIMDMRSAIKFGLDYDRTLSVNLKAQYEVPMFGFRDGALSMWFDALPEVQEASYAVAESLDYKSEDIVDIRDTTATDFSIRWQVTYLCNHECPFCIQGTPEEHARKSAGESNELYMKICDAIVNLIEGKQKNIRVNLIGGEVTILEAFVPIVTKLKQAKTKSTVKINVTTNGTIPDTKIKALADLFADAPPNVSMHFAVSYYPEYMTRDELKQVVTKLGSIPKFTVSVSKLLFMDDDVDQYLAFAQWAMKAMPMASVLPIVARDKEGHVSIRADQRGKLSSRMVSRGRSHRGKGLQVIYADGCAHTFRTLQEMVCSLRENQFNPRGYYCDAGANVVTIDHLGNVSTCFGMNKALGNIAADGFRLNDVPMICTADRCNCKLFTHVWKE